MNNFLAKDLIAQNTLALAEDKNLTLQIDLCDVSEHPHDYYRAGVFVTGSTGKAAIVSQVQLNSKMMGDSIEDAVENYTQSKNATPSDIVWMPVYSHNDSQDYSTTPATDSNDAPVGFIFESKESNQMDFDDDVNIKQVFDTKLKAIAVAANFTNYRLVIMRGDENIDGRNFLHGEEALNDAALDMINEIALEAV